MHQKNGSVEYNKKNDPAVPVFGNNQLKDQGYNKVILKLYGEGPIYRIKPCPSRKNIQISQVGEEINPIQMKGRTAVIG
jgi:hypothetical protein